MTKRFFYTDPLAAAWMAKHFGMLIALRVLPHSPWYEADDDLSGCIDMPADDIAALIRQLLDKHGSDYEPGRYYVHPHSTQLLQPQDGDFVEFERWYWARKRGEDYVKDAPAQMICGWVRKNISPNRLGGEWFGINNVGVGFDDNYVGSFEMPFRIIQRRGIAFHHPESEGE